jgi:hypothetical protein
MRQDCPGCGRGHSRAEFCICDYGREREAEFEAAIRKPTYSVEDGANAPRHPVSAAAKECDYCGSSGCGREQCKSRKRGNFTFRDARADTVWKCGDCGGSFAPNDDALRAHKCGPLVSEPIARALSQPGPHDTPMRVRLMPWRGEK